MSEKVKNRFTSIDVTAMVNNLKSSLIGMKYIHFFIFINNLKTGSIIYTISIQKLSS